MEIRSLEGYDYTRLKRMGYENWQLDQLRLNPGYVFWGPGEEYMMEGKGWARSLLRETWPDMELRLDDLNEVVSFYFFIHRESEDCPDCAGSTYNPETKKLADAFYNNSADQWCDKITQDEVDMLVQKGRLPAGVTAEEVNSVNRTGRALKGIMAHDAINRTLLIRYRAEHLGVYGRCDKCEEDGEVFTQPEVRLGLVFWLIHPRKGASRSVRVAHILQSDLPEVYAFLKQASARNQERFAKIP